jgi:septal ring factor EnvC (AmiA/AmiB activator)
MRTELRLQQLADNIRQDLNLLKEYEDELRYETDRRRLAKYRREIERQRESLTRYQQEYEELQKQVIGEPSAKMGDTENLLRQMDAKLDDLQRDQIDEIKREKKAASRQFFITDDYLEERLERIKDFCSRNLSYIHSLGLFKHYTIAVETSPTFILWDSLNITPTTDPLIRKP